MSKNATLLLTLAIAGSFLKPATADDSKPSIRVTMPKTTFILNEPIRIVVEIDNPTKHSIHVLNGFTFGDAFLGRKQRSIVVRPSLDADVEWTTIIMPLQSVGIGPRAKHKQNVFLQEFAFQPKVGKHRIDYSVQWPGSYEGKPDLPGVYLSAKGQLEFIVEAADDEAQKKMMASIADKVISEFRPFGDTESIAAISTIDDHKVVPYLAKILDTNRNNQSSRLWLHRVAESARRFSGNRSVVWKVDDALRGRKSDLTMGEALTLMEIWRIRIPQELIDQIRKRDDKELNSRLDKCLKALAKDLKDTE